MAAYKVHLYRYHTVRHQLNRVNRNHDEKILCDVCEIVVNGLDNLSSHYRLHFDGKNSIPCVLNNCHSVFTVYSSYRSHMSRYHHDVVKVDIANQYRPKNRIEVFQDEVRNEVSEEDDLVPSLNSTPNDCRKYLGKMMLKL